MSGVVMVGLRRETVHDVGKSNGHVQRLYGNAREAQSVVRHVLHIYAKRINSRSEAMAMTRPAIS
jgi:hypothetical protein